MSEKLKNEQESFYSSNIQKENAIGFPVIEENDDLKELFSFSEPFAIISFCAGNRIGTEIMLEDMAKLLSINGSKLIHLCGILERVGVLSITAKDKKVIITVMEMSNIHSRNAVYSVIREKKEEYILLYEKFSKSKYSPRVTLN